MEGWMEIDGVGEEMGTGPDLLGPGEVVAGNGGRDWVVEGKLGGGGFGQVYKAVSADGEDVVAIKVESTAKDAKQVLNMESFVLRRYQNFRHSPTYFDYGTSNTFNYMVLSLCSRNLSELRRDSPTQRFSRSTAFRLGRQSLEALRDLHSVGVLHRDIKPSNFALGLRLDSYRTVFLLDYGLARIHLDDHGKPKKPREDAGFRGTVRYAPVAAHEKRELGRKDDLWSWLYMIIEMIRGVLPWRRLRDKTEVGRWKARIGTDLCDEMPNGLAEVQRHLASLSYESAPDYGGMDTVLAEVLGRMGVREADKLDWEEAYASAEAEAKTRSPGSRRRLQRTVAAAETKAEREGGSAED